MDLVVVISVEFLVEDSLCVVNIGDILPDTGSDQSVLEPAIRSLDLASGLR